MTKLADLTTEFLSDPDNKAAYYALAPEFNLALGLSLLWWPTLF